MKLQQFQHFIIMHLYRCFNFHSVFLSPLYFVFSDPRQGCLLRHKTKKRKRTRKVMKRKLTRRWRGRGGKRRRGLILRLLRPLLVLFYFLFFHYMFLFFLSLSVYFLACFLFAFLMLARVLLLVHAIKIKMKWKKKRKNFLLAPLAISLFRFWPLPWELSGYGLACNGIFHSHFGSYYSHIESKMV